MSKDAAKKQPGQYTALAQLLTDMFEPEPLPKFTLLETGRVLDACERGEDPVPDFIVRTLQFALEQSQQPTRKRLGAG
ncbi:hypothetical protein [Melittangium boletus]|uniref:Uncharacterized protein n=1 Tax=Melittangium boletus DSM 14713 TaxID=1294270 RepID=A0A250INF0_9BACT|nr:hypothetical protein [Melittangium boletus]ATB32752.1 hypothetical protein MEBOL_006241 [Melittangium boletus DSM 14713]